jgi:iron-sulfur cluster repair protein YtfE (RIC family)
MGTRYPPRKLELGALVKALVEEHGVMKAGLQRAELAARAGDFEGVSKALKEIDPVFRQHIADEEATVLGLLIRTLGVKGAQSEILVFRQHRPIYQLMEKVAELAERSPGELSASQSELKALFEEHTSSEEKLVFPKALRLNAGEPARA